MRRFTAVAAALIVAVMLTLTLSSCFYSNNATTNTETVHKEPAPDTVYPADVAGKIDLKAEDPSNGDVKFTFDESGRVSECDYSKDGVKYYVGYTYGKDTVTASLFATKTVNSKGEEGATTSELYSFVLDTKEYKFGADFDRSVGFIEQDGFYFNGFKSLEEVPMETVPVTTEGESKAEGESTDTKAEADSTGEDTAADTAEAADKGTEDTTAE